MHIYTAICTSPTCTPLNTQIHTHYHIANTLAFAKQLYTYMHLLVHMCLTPTCACMRTYKFVEIYICT